MITPSQVHLRIARVVVEPGAEALDAQALSLAIEQHVAALWGSGVAAPSGGAHNPHAAVAGTVATTLQQRLDGIAVPASGAPGDGHAGR